MHPTHHISSAYLHILGIAVRCSADGVLARREILPPDVHVACYLWSSRGHFPLRRLPCTHPSERLMFHHRASLPPSDFGSTCRRESQFDRTAMFPAIRRLP